MATYKTCELEGPLLDAAVAKAEGWTVEAFEGDDLLLHDASGKFQKRPLPWSSMWEFGGPIIEREVISLSAPLCVGDYGEWIAYVGGSADSEKGPTPLIAAMRAYVCSKLGDVVDLP